MKRTIALIWIGVLCLALLLYSFLSSPRDEPEVPTAPTGQTETTTPTESETQDQSRSETETHARIPTEPEVKTAQVRILNQDAGLQAAWEKIAAEYTKSTGVTVTVISADDTDKAQPTLFTLSGEEELAQWQDQCLDLSGSAAYAQLASMDLVLRTDEKVCGIAQDVDGFGLIYNSSLLARAGYTRADINSIDSLKAVAQLITANSKELGFSAFTHPALKASVARRLSSVPGNVREFWNLYITNVSGNAGNASAANSLQELLDGKAVFYIAGIRDYGKLASLGDHQLGILPLYIGRENEENQGLCVAATGYWCVRNDAPEEDIQATLDFLSYLVQPDEDGKVPVDALGLLAPYRQATSANNVLEAALRSDLATGKKCLICKSVSSTPKGLADALAAYAAAPTDENWNEVILALQG